ncbi:4'-phosphopantetheinyl transferase superfamily [Glomus cerebriforme]|uniref:4'-phosphopantetheinyl transferase superfamily n=1 Tax=Glomus cerebriforme TaxID=658196 RepID=A0A397THN2_9GLOM|nr:4'-phosphopantetheinyl transferase superfamily [Glomus cerebriforme]
MILGIGIDIIHLSRIQTLLLRKPTSLLHFSKRILSDGELKEFNIFLSNQKNNFSVNGLAQNNLKQDKVIIDNNIIRFLAVRWTLKEATYKALFPHYHLIWKDISINKIEGKPQLIIHNAKQKGINNIKIHSSVSHDKEYIISQVLIEGTID